MSRDSDRSADNGTPDQAHTSRVCRERLLRRTGLLQLHDHPTRVKAGRAPDHSPSVREVGVRGRGSVRRGQRRSGLDRSRRQRQGEGQRDGGATQVHRRTLRQSAQTVGGVRSRRGQHFGLKNGSGLRLRR